MRLLHDDEAASVLDSATGSIHSETIQLAVDTGRSVYDSLYLALAIFADCKLVTADERFANALRATRS